MGGWVKNHRKIKDWCWYKKPLTAHLFQHLVREANHKEGEFMGIKVSRGQVITGRKTLAHETGLSEQQIRTAIKHLTSTNEIILQATNKFSIITVCNYDEYQHTKEEGQPAHQPADATEMHQRATTNKKGRNKEIKKQQTEVAEWLL